MAHFPVPIRRRRCVESPHDAYLTIAARASARCGSATVPRREEYAACYTCTRCASVASLKDHCLGFRPQRQADPGQTTWSRHAHHLRSAAPTFPCEADEEDASEERAK